MIGNTLLVSLALLAVGLFAEGVAGPYSLWGIGPLIGTVGVLGTGLSGGIYWGMLEDS